MCCGVLQRQYTKSKGPASTLRQGRPSLSCHIADANYGRVAVARSRTTGFFERCDASGIRQITSRRPIGIMLPGNTLRGSSSARLSSPLAFAVHGAEVCHAPLGHQHPGDNGQVGGDERAQHDVDGHEPSPSHRVVPGRCDQIVSGDQGSGINRLRFQLPARGMAGIEGRAARPHLPTARLAANANTALVADHRAAALVAVTAVVAATVVTGVLIATTASVITMVPLLVATAVTVVVASLRIGSAGATDGRGDHSDCCENRADFHEMSFRAPGSKRGEHYAADTTTFLTNRATASPAKLADTQSR